MLFYKLKYPRTLLLISTLVLIISALTKCNTTQAPETIAEPTKWDQYAGSATCVSCHKDIYEKHVKTTHFLTTQLPSEKTIRGSFDAGKNKVVYSPGVWVAMEKRGDKFYQAAYSHGDEKVAQPFDLVIGPGTIGQSYLFWNKRNLFQLPVSYFSPAKQWANSPGFPHDVLYDRPINSRCLECHTTYTEALPQGAMQPLEFDKSKMILGVDCERCHGPAKQHVEFQTKNPTSSLAKFIINPAKLNRQQNLDLCALCHGGRLQKLKPSFEFTAGNSLSDYFDRDLETPDPNRIDVHGNQYGLLKASKCFLHSNTLTCNSCHNTHENERGNTALFSQRCMSCHDKTHEPLCKLTATQGQAINTNCIDCHMPVKSSLAISVNLPGTKKLVAAQIRSHFISIYPKETNKVLMGLKKSRKTSTAL